MATQPVRARPLTRRQLHFIQFYRKHYNASRAAREAGYSLKTAYSIGWENLRKPQIKAALDTLLPDYSFSSRTPIGNHLKHT
ncbi:hypothetical protein GCM10028808_74670 [Spirosoma migulaei]